MNATNHSNTARRRATLDAELAAAKTATDAAVTWRHLERAHILSQPDALPHLNVHWRMLLLALRTTDVREFAGQVLRLLLAMPGSWSGRYPRGNSGRARISAFLQQPVPPDLEALLD